jgi:hypothetical protein
VPAAAVIPAPIVYMKVAAVKKLVVGLFNNDILSHYYQQIISVALIIDNISKSVEFYML